VIAGAGVAGLETLLALRALAGPRVTTTVLAPNPTFSIRAAAVGTPFGHGSPPQHDVQAIVAASGAHLVHGTLDVVDADERSAVTREGEHLMYDALVVAVGAHPESAYTAASTFTGAPGSTVMSDALLELEAGRAQSIAFVVPPGVTWALPLYELALMTAAHLELHGIDADVSVVTPEPAPLALLGIEASEHVIEALRNADITLVSATEVTEVDLAGRLLGRAGTILQAEQIIALPRLRAPSIGGLPRADDGFIPVDVQGHVAGRDGVYAIGDAAAGLLKHGGLGAQQAEGVAHEIAQRAGAPVATPTPRPVVRAQLFEGSTTTFLRAPLSGRVADRTSVVSRDALWWPPLKVAAPRLAQALAESASACARSARAACA
jgi:sulfide:quinone oxidoreductase